jgi:hypothetical protein
MVFIKTQELIRHPVEWPAGMRATVDVAIYAIIPAHDKYLMNSIPEISQAPFTARVGQFIQTAE